MLYVDLLGLCIYNMESRGIGRRVSRGFRKPPVKFGHEFVTGTQHTIQFGYSKQLIVMTQHNNLL